MGREWDSFGSPKEYQDWVTNWATLLIDRLYPGAVCLFFGGTRMWHRLACGLEDAGLEVHDTLIYLYGTGFPKSHDVSKAIDQQAGAERAWYEVPRNGGGDSSDHVNQLRGRKSGIKMESTPATTDAERWDGYGTALKPAWEPIILCRKPRTTTYAEHALEHGTGALWIDGCRIGVTTQGRWPANLLLTHLPECERVGEKRVEGITGGTIRKPTQFLANNDDGHSFHNYADEDGKKTVADWECAEGCPVAMLDEQSGESVSNRRTGKRAGKDAGRYGVFAGQDFAVIGHNDTGGASRFFYTAKASRSERNAGLPDDIQNKHPTIKPLSITEYLARLVLPPELDESRRILVPFAGTGSEMIGAGLAGWDEIVGVEMNGEAVAVAEYRLAHWLDKPRQLQL